MCALKLLQAVASPLDARAAERAARKAAPDTAGRRWFDLPATPITPEVTPSLPFDTIDLSLSPWYKSRAAVLRAVEAAMCLA